MSKDTRRGRYQKTASALRHLLNYGILPNVEELPYYKGYRAFELWEDRFGVWLKLMRTDRFIAIIEQRRVRISPTTSYRPILEAFAKRTNRRIVLMGDRVVPTSRHLIPVGSLASCHTEVLPIPYPRPERHGRPEFEYIPTTSVQRWTTTSPVSTSMWVDSVELDNLPF